NTSRDDGGNRKDGKRPQRSGARGQPLPGSRRLDEGATRALRWLRNYRGDALHERIIVRNSAQKKHEKCGIPHWRNSSALKFLVTSNGYRGGQTGMLRAKGCV